MQKNVEDVKKEFEEKILIIGNKLCYVFFVINLVAYIAGNFFRIFVLNETPHFIIVWGILFVANAIYVLSINIVHKWKTNITRYLCIIVSIIVASYGLYVLADSDILIFIFACLSLSVIFLDSFFVFITGVTALVSLLCVAFCKIIKNGTETYEMYIWKYYFSILMIIIFTTLFVIACKWIKKTMLNAQIDEYEMEKAKKDNALASKIQDGFLNHEFPENEVYDINASMIPSKDVGGDFYDFFMIDKTRLAMVMADVSGKGIPAALLMANAKTVIKNSIVNGVSFEKSLETANRDIMRENKEMQFITLLICIVDLVSGKMNYINAGHVKPLVVNKDGDVSIIASKPDFIFGVRKGVRYHSKEYMLNPGDKLFLCTDGVTERLNVENKLYGKERVIEVLKENAKSNAKDTTASILDSLDKYSEGREQNDDITCLIFDYKKKLVLEPALEKDFDVSRDKTEDIIMYIKEALKIKDVPDKTINLIAVASDEIISNVSKYAYDDIETEKILVVNIQVYNRIINIRYIDRGKYFNPLNRITLSGTTKVTDKSKIGGLGIQLTWNIMDNISYDRVDDKNMITIEKEY